MKSKRLTLRVKMALLVLAILVFVVLFGLIICNAFLPGYYSNRNRALMIRSFEQIYGDYLEGLEMASAADLNSIYYTTFPGNNYSTDSIPGESSYSPDAIDDNVHSEYQMGQQGDNVAEDENRAEYILSEDLQLEIDKISMDDSLSVLIYRSVSSSSGIYGLKVNQKVNRLLYSSLGIGGESKLNNDKIYSDYMNAIGRPRSNLAAGTYRTSYVDIERVAASYLYLEGRMPNGDYILIRSPVSSINQSVKTSNDFFMIILIAASIIGFVITYFVTGNISRPIEELGVIASRMANMDFTARYEPTSDDEIDDLGNNMNVLASNLEKSLGELRDANAMLRTDIKKREEIDEFRKEFVSNISHELKTPIALIQGYAEGLIDNVNDDEESREFYCDVILDEAKKMTGLVNQIMQLNQLEFGYSRVNTEYFDMTSLISSVIKKSAILIEEKGVKIEFDDSRQHFVWCDTYLAEEVFTNYFTNALNHVSGEKLIRVGMFQLGNILRIFVYNTGEKIPVEALERIWDKFYKVDKSRSREYGGSGVGLSIVKATMDILGQEYGVRNEVDGVTFWFDLDSSDTQKDEEEIEFYDEDENYMDYLEI